MCASGKLSPKLPVVLYEPADMPKKAKEEIPNYLNLEIYWSKSGLMGSEIAKLWMKNVFLRMVKNDSVLIIDSWTGYKQMMEMQQNAAKKLKIVTLPPGSTSDLQPADVYFNRTFKNFIRKVCCKVRWQNNDFILTKRENLLSILDMIWYQWKAPRFEPFLKYAGYTLEHPPEFKTPTQLGLLEVKGYMKCEEGSCTKFFFLKCAHCSRHFCFKDALKHRDDMDL